MKLDAHLYISIFVILAFCFSLLFNHILIRFYQTFGIRIKEIEQERWNPNQKPSLGGISMYLTFLFSVIFLLFMPNKNNTLNISLLGFLISASLAFLMGFADDAYNTQPLIKFLSQVLCAVILAFTGHYVQISSHPILNYLLTIFWVVFLMNAFNLLDNMDGIVALVALVITVCCAYVVYCSSGIWNYLFLLNIGIIGAVSGFVIYNFYPSRIFMGDSGSQFLGLFYAGMSIDLFLNIPNVLQHFEAYTCVKTLVATGSVFIAPLSDTVVVSLNRIIKGSSPFIGGKDHTTHAFYMRGFRVSWISIIYMLISIIGVLLALALKFSWFNNALPIALIFDLVIFLGFFINTFPLKTGSNV